MCYKYGPIEKKKWIQVYWGCRSVMLQSVFFFEFSFFFFYFLARRWTLECVRTRNHNEEEYEEKLIKIREINAKKSFIQLLNRESNCSPSLPLFTSLSPSLLPPRIIRAQRSLKSPLILLSSGNRTEVAHPK